jgi:hypothetical protein
LPIASHREQVFWFASRPFFFLADPGNLSIDTQFDHACEDPEAEVISLSPRTLVATNRFVCEICNKGFQRDQNLQLHRRGHNLPWKLRHRTPSAGGRQGDAAQPPRKRVYVCPEPTCIHHDPTRYIQVFC